jgi:murein DD-endopeptidase MepM/ murein hydrolase activator NlpD
MRSRLASLAALLAASAAVLLALVTPLAAEARADDYADAVAAFKPAWTDAEPKTAVDKWLAPFADADRTKMKAVRLVSEFGAPRQSYVKGHWHTGTDLWPRVKTEPHVEVFAMANGVVVSVHLADPHLTVVVKHKLKDGTSVWTSYKHLQSTTAQIGQEVTPDTKLGRLYTKKEAKAQGGDYDHLHLEIRKNVDDYGVGSWMTMAKADLAARFYDPWDFMKKKLGEAR